jgi:transposase
LPAEPWPPSPYSPELNAIERVWLYLRDRYRSRADA